MTWRDQLRDASFRGVPFEVDSVDNTGGRRAVVHEFPLRDDPQTEDLGRAARSFTFDAYVIGAEYFAARDALIAALEAPGPGTLVHPYFGEVQVQIGEVRWRESTREGGMCTFSITCHRHVGAVYPVPVADTRALSESAVDAGEAASSAELAERLNADGQPQRVIDAARDIVTSAVSAMRSAIATITSVPAEAAVFAGLADNLTNAAASLVLSPADLASEITGLVRQVVTAADRPRAALDALQGMFGFGSDLPAQPAATPTGAVMAGNQAALTGHIQQLVTLEACRAAAQSDYESFDDAIAVRDALIEQLDLLAESDIEDALYTALVGARAAMSRDISARGADLARLVKIQLPDTLPALALAWELYADANRADELVARNRVSDPLHMPSGVPLEALDA